MRLDNGMRFENCMGLKARDGANGSVFDVDTYVCHDKPLHVGDYLQSFGVGIFQYRGENNIGNSVFVQAGQSSECETVERAYKDRFVVLEVYLMMNGRYKVLPYVQSNATSSGSFVREGFQFAGEFDTAEAAAEAGWAAGKERTNTLYLD